MTLGLGENGLSGAAVKNQGGDRTAPIYICIYGHPVIGFSTYLMSRSVRADVRGKRFHARHRANDNPSENVAKSPLDNSSKDYLE